jgi:hypothetical protein
VTVTDKYISSKGYYGRWIIYAYVEILAYEGTHAQNNGYCPRRYINILDKKAVERFINTTYENYVKYIPHLKDKISAFFTDEPSLMASYQNTDKKFEYAVIPWHNSITENFLKDHSYDIKYHLHSLFDGFDEEDKKVRVHFYQTISNMIASNYFRKINNWCIKNNIVFSGHALLEESMVYHVAYYGDLMNVLKEMQYPGVDMLMSNPELYMSDKMGYFLAVKYASSAARAAGKNEIMAEICPIYGVGERQTPTLEGEVPPLKDMIGLASLLYFNGVNHVNSYYMIDKYDKSIYSKYCEYVGRLGVMLDGAVHIPDAGIYYPIETFQGNFVPITREVANQRKELWDLHNFQMDFIKKLFMEKLDFNFLDSKAIIEGKIEKNSLKVFGLKYKAIIMIKTEIIPLEVMEKLSEFKKQGGKVLWVGCLPDVVIADKKHTRIHLDLYKMEIEDNPFEVLKKILPEGLKITEYNNTEKIFVSCYKKKDYDMYMIVNTDKFDVNISIEAKEMVDLEVYNPYDGLVEVKRNCFDIRIRGYSSIFVMK